MYSKGKDRIVKQTMKNNRSNIKFCTIDKGSLTSINSFFDSLFCKFSVMFMEKPEESSVR